MKLFIQILLLLSIVFAYTVNENEKANFCSNLNCEYIEDKSVCGIREDGQGFRLRLFENECELLKHGCSVDEKEAFGLINKKYCDYSFFKDYDKETDDKHNLFRGKSNAENKEGDPNFCENCPYTDDNEKVCGIRNDGVGFRIKLFLNKCELLRFNCISNLQFNVTDFYICDWLQADNVSKLTENIKLFEDKHKKNTDNNIPNGENNEFSSNIEILKNIFVVDGSILDNNKNINDSIDNFFAATHVMDMPVSNVQESARRRLINIFGPAVVFKPWVIKPENISEDHDYLPTLTSCYHKCPRKCPETYAPVCGVPGIIAREPSLMFQNHCFMDVAQCKMYWEDKSPTSQSSSYIESSFLFCLGDELNGLYRFLPLLRTLQHMGRIKKKGYFRYKLRNMKFFNNLMMKDPKLMG